MVIVFEESYENEDYGYYRCSECKVEEYGGGKFHHKEGCSHKKSDFVLTNDTYEGCSYVIGPNMIEKVKKLAKQFGDDFPEPYTSLTFNKLRELFPEQVEKGEV